jgi:hypothetical protein
LFTGAGSASTSAFLVAGIRQHTSAYVSIRQHTSAYVRRPPQACKDCRMYVCMYIGCIYIHIYIIHIYIHTYIQCVDLHRLVRTAGALVH